ncbi:hypothetical protein C8R42DRAFT_577035, partial [Lentinula raphanica]
MSERLSTTELRFGSCCLSGKVSLPYLQSHPIELENLFRGQDLNSKHFLENIRSYNSAFAFVSLGLNKQPRNDPELPTTGPRQYKIKGELWHAMGSLLPEPGKSPVYAQLYIISPETALTKRLANNQHHGTGLSQPVMQTIQDCLYRNNNFVNLYKSAYERIQDLEQNAPDTISAHYVKLHFSDTNDPRVYNQPTADEVAVILPGPEAPKDHRDIILQCRNGPLKRIYETSPAYAPLHYVLLL